MLFVIQYSNVNYFLPSFLFFFFSFFLSFFFSFSLFILIYLLDCILLFSVKIDLVIIS